MQHPILNADEDGHFQESALQHIKDQHMCADRIL